MPRIEADAIIDRPVSDVWDSFIDLTHSPRWTRSACELPQTAPGAPGRHDDRERASDVWILARRLPEPEGLAKPQE